MFLKPELVFLSLFAVLFSYSSCKSKKKTAEVTNQQEQVVDTVSQKVESPKDKPQGFEVQSVILDDSEIAYKTGDAYTIDTAYIVRGILLVKCSYSGGCKEHEFNLYTDGSLMKSLPPQLKLNLNHNANEDPCESWVTTALRFDLSKAHAEGHNKVQLNLSNYNYKIPYTYGDQ
ncbi:MAG: hypothetical protein MRY83_00010 [Flavobacteriales bacterium]|nr:hypothetical protein [Flavobacteriales bacterium]